MSAAAWWNPSGSPAAAIAAAISSISPTQRHPLAAADPSAPCQRFSSAGQGEHLVMLGQQSR